MAGKTARMVKYAADLAMRDHRVVFVACSLRDERLKYLSQVGVTVLADGEELPPDIDEHSAIWFYDEFDWLQSTKIRMGAYYATTPKRLRTAGVELPESDLLLALVKAAGYRHERNFLLFDMAENWKEARQLYSESEFRRLFLGEFLQ
jgi:hypothetical protein